MIAQFNEFKNSISGKDPQAIVQHLLATGQMSQAQFNLLANQANALVGLFK